VSALKKIRVTATVWPAATEVAHLMRSRGFSVSVGLLTLLMVRPPDLLVSGDGKTIAARAADGGLYIASPNARGYVADTWWKRDGAAGFKPWPRQGAGADGRLRCDPLGCAYRQGGVGIAVVRDPAALVEDCAHAALVVAPTLTRTGCRAAKVVDRKSLLARGAHAVWIEGKTLLIRDDRSERGERPWVSYPWQDAEAGPARRRRTAARE
jgi:competence protein ComEC